MKTGKTKDPELQRAAEYILLAQMGFSIDPLGLPAEDVSMILEIGRDIALDGGRRHG